METICPYCGTEQTLRARPRIESRPDLDAPLCVYCASHLPIGTPLALGGEHDRARRETMTTNSTAARITLTGSAAISAAERLGLDRVRAYDDPTETHPDGTVTLDHAREIAREDGGLVYLELTARTWRQV